MASVNKRRKKFDNNKLESLVQKKENEQLKSIIGKNNTSALVYKLLYLSVKYNNLDLLKFLLTLDCDVNTKDSSGSTLLMLAVSNYNVKAIRLLLDNNADVCISNAAGKSAFEILMDLIDSGKSVSTNLVKYCLEKFNVSNVNIQTKATILIGTDCTLEDVLYVRNPLVTQAVLERKNTIDHEDYKTAVTNAMKSLDVENVRTLIHHGLGREISKRKFFDNLINNISKIPQINSSVFEKFISVIIDLNVINQDYLCYFHWIFTNGSQEGVQTLMQYNIDVYLKNTFAYSFEPVIFSNKNLNVIELMKDRNFDINERARYSHMNRSALHYSLRSNSKELIEYLLDLGADPDIRDEFDNTPIISGQAWSASCLGKLFLQYGADVQAVNSLQTTVFTIANYKHILSCILPHVAMLEAQGTPISEQISAKINSQKLYRGQYTNHLKQAKSLKEYMISESVSFLKILTGKPEEIARLLHYEDINIALIQEYCKENRVHSYYSSTVEFKLHRVLNIKLSHCAIAMIVSKLSGTMISFDHLVVETISGFLTYRDMLGLAPLVNNI